MPTIATTTTITQPLNADSVRIDERTVTYKNGIRSLTVKVTPYVKSTGVEGPQQTFRTTDLDKAAGEIPAMHAAVTAADGQMAPAIFGWHARNMARQADVGKAAQGAADAESAEAKAKDAHAPDAAKLSAVRTAMLGKTHTPEMKQAEVDALVAAQKSFAAWGKAKDATAGAKATLARAQAALADPANATVASS